MRSVVSFAVLSLDNHFVVCFETIVIGIWVRDFKYPNGSSTAADAVRKKKIFPVSCGRKTKPQTCCYTFQRHATNGSEQGLFCFQNWYRKQILKKHKKAKILKSLIRTNSIWKIDKKKITTKKKLVKGGGGKMQERRL